MFMMLTKSIEDTIPFPLLYMREASDIAAHCVPAFNHFGSQLVVMVLRAHRPLGTIAQFFHFAVEENKKN